MRRKTRVANLKAEGPPILPRELTDCSSQSDSHTEKEEYEGKDDEDKEEQGGRYGAGDSTYYVYW